MPIDQGGPKRHALGVDFGTSNTVAVARWPDGRARPILLDGSPLMPSAVYAEPDGQLIAGRDAVHSARLDPARFEPNPKRRIDEGTVLLGDHEVPVVDLIATVLGRVAEEWRRTVGDAPTDVTLTCPATWGATRRTLLAEAARRAGLGDVRLVAEPVAAATYFAEVLGRDVPIGSVVVVHDFGAGTFDASVVARTAEGFEVLAVDGRDDIGGLDVDAAIVEHLRTDDPEWRRLTEPQIVADRRAQRQLWDDVRIAKERLSRTQSADLVIPLLNREVHLTRDELEQLARPALDQTVQVTRRLLRWAELPEGRLAGVFLVGGASRIPLVATLLHRELGEAPVVIEQPELVVAEGSILADAALLATGPAAPGLTAELRLVFERRAQSETAVQDYPDFSAQHDLDSPPNSDLVRTPSSSTVTPAEPAAGSGPLAAAGAIPGSAHPGSAGALSGTAAAGLAGAATGRPDGAGAADAPGMASSASAGPARPISGAGPARASADDQETVRSRPDGSPLPPPAVDPWPHATDDWAPDPEATVASDPTWRREAIQDEVARQAGATRPVSPSSAYPQSPAHPRSPSRPEVQGRSSSIRPLSPASGYPFSPGSARPTSPARPAPTAHWDSPASRPAAPARVRRRPGGFARFLQVLLSALVLIAAPLVALVFAYSYNTGEPLSEAISQLLDQAQNLIGRQ